MTPFEAALKAFNNEYWKDVFGAEHNSACKRGMAAALRAFAEANPTEEMRDRAQIISMTNGGNENLARVYILAGIDKIDEGEC